MIQGNSSKRAIRVGRDRRMPIGWTVLPSSEAIQSVDVTKCTTGQEIRRSSQSFVQMVVSKRWSTMLLLLAQKEFL